MSRPRWIIDDTSKPGCIFCEHTKEPRLIGELLSWEDAPKEGTFLPAPDGQWLTNIRWLENTGDGIVYERMDMYNSLATALEAHQAAKGQKPVTRHP